MTPLSIHGGLLRAQCFSKAQSPLAHPQSHIPSLLLPALPQTYYQSTSGLELNARDLHSFAFHLHSTYFLSQNTNIHPPFCSWLSRGHPAFLPVLSCPSPDLMEHIWKEHLAGPGTTSGLCFLSSSHKTSLTSSVSVERHMTCCAQCPGSSLGVPATEE